MSIAENIKNIQKKLPAGVTLIAAAKGKSVDAARQAIAAGITVIGENYVQDAQEKFQVLGHSAQWHCIGHLQTNKVKKAVEIFDVIQTVDSLSLARTIDKECGKISKVMPILIEVNSGLEPQKAGVMPDMVEPLLSQLLMLKNIKPVGLMTMGLAPWSASDFTGPDVQAAENIRRCFAVTKKLFETIRLRYKDVLDWRCLSMGMSDSWEIAVQEGATMVRVGTAIFGART